MGIQATKIKYSQMEKCCMEGALNLGNNQSCSREEKSAKAEERRQKAMRKGELKLGISENVAVAGERVACGKGSFLFFFFFWYWGLDSRPCTCYAGALPLKPCLQPQRSFYKSWEKFMVKGFHPRSSQCGRKGNRVEPKGELRGKLWRKVIRACVREEDYSLGHRSSYQAAFPPHPHPLPAPGLVLLGVGR
jgi:hypothetical protein